MSQVLIAAGALSWNLEPNEWPHLVPAGDRDETRKAGPRKRAELEDHPETTQQQKNGCSQRPEANQVPKRNPEAAK